jgi:hypothetical protein
MTVWSRGAGLDDLKGRLVTTPAEHAFLLDLLAEEFLEDVSVRRS